MARKLRWRCEGLTFESCIGPYTKEVSLRFICYKDKRQAIASAQLGGGLGVGAKTK